MHGQQYIK